MVQGPNAGLETRYLTSCIALHNNVSGSREIEMNI